MELIECEIELVSLVDTDLISVILPVIDDTVVVPFAVLDVPVPVNVPVVVVTVIVTFI